MTVFLTGGTGFTGSHTVPILLRTGKRVRCLARPTSDTSCIPDGAEIVQGDLDDRDGLARAMEGCDELVNVASLGFGHGPNIVHAALEAGIRRAVFISTTSVFTSLNAPSKKMRLAAEQTIMDSGLDWTILRPTMIYGTEGDRNMCRLIRAVKKSPLFLVFGSGRFLMQPVHVRDVAGAAVKVLDNENTIGRDYNVSGSAPLTFNEVVDTTARALGIRRRKIHIPASPVIGMLKTMERIGLKMPVKAEQVQRLNEDKAFDHLQASRDFGFRPISFQEGIEEEVRLMGLAGRESR